MENKERIKEILEELVNKLHETDITCNFSEKEQGEADNLYNQALQKILTMTNKPELDMEEVVKLLFHSSKLLDLNNRRTIERCFEVAEEICSHFSSPSQPLILPEKMECNHHRNPIGVGESCNCFECSIHNSALDEIRRLNPNRRVVTKEEIEKFLIQWEKDNCYDMLPEQLAQAIFDLLTQKE